MKTKITFLALAIITSAANAVCIPAGEEQYAVLDVAVVTGTKPLRDFMVSKYCYNSPKFYKEVSKPQHKLFQGVFKSRSIDDLKIFYPPGTPISYFGEGNYERDLLSFIVSAYHSPHIDKENERLAQKYLPNVKININPSPLTVKEHDELINYIADQYNKESYTFVNKYDNNNMFHYVVTADNAQIFKKLLDNQSSRELFLYKKNGVGITPIHMMFANKKPYNKSTEKEDTHRLNEEMIKYILPLRVKYLSYYDNTENKIDFFDFAEIVKDKNPEFYKMLKDKFNFNSKITNEQIKVLKPKLLKAMNISSLDNSYIERD